MRTLSQLELLELWERGAEQRPVERSLALLSRAYEEDPAQLTWGECSARLFRLRALMFGEEISALAKCPRCGESLEITFQIPADHETGAARQQALALSAHGYEASFRLPNMLDLRSSQPAADQDEAQRTLLQRCLLSLSFAGKTVPADELPEEMIMAISQAMAGADPDAEVSLPLHCAQCQFAWSEDFDIESFFWAEIQAWSRRMLNEVHQLAAAYGWSEAEILQLSPLRRHVYLNLIAE